VLHSWYQTSLGYDVSGQLGSVLARSASCEVNEVV
jgi:hypothetical protein